MSKVWIATSMIGACVLGAAVWWGGDRATTGMEIPHTDPKAVAAGKELYRENCAACHGAQLQGQVRNWRQPLANGRLPAPPHDETGHTWHHPDAQLFQITRLGTAEIVGGGYESDMPGFSQILSDVEILAVLAFIKSTWPSRVVREHDRRNAAATGG